MKILLSLAFSLVVGLASAQIADPNAPLDPAKYSPPIRVACVGDSITFGGGTKNPATESYPAQLQAMLGTGWQVGNFGESGATLLNSGDSPYQKRRGFARATAFNPNVVVIMLGTNDTKPQNWKFKNLFAADYKELVRIFQALPAKPRVFVCRPVIVPNGGKYGINETAIRQQLPLIASVAQNTGTGVIDLHATLVGHAALLPDNVHPNAAGANLMARTVAHALTGKSATAVSQP